MYKRQIQSWGRILSLVNSDASNFITLGHGAPRQAYVEIYNDAAMWSTDFVTTQTDFFPAIPQWVHVALTVTPAGALTFFRDGETQAGWQTSDGIAANPERVTYTRAALGRYEQAADELYYADVALRDVRLYNRALSAGEVVQIKKAG